MKKLITFFSMVFAVACLNAETVTKTTAGDSTWVCPVGTTSVTVECWGGGGAGGSAYRVGGSARTGGGAGGSYSKRTFTNLVPGQSYSFHVGAGGTATASVTVSGVASAANGASTSFNDADVVAIGGQGGADLYISAASGSFVSAGGLASALGTNVGSLSYLGGNAANGGDNLNPVGSSVGAGGGGGSAGASGAGGQAGTLYSGVYYGITAGAAGAGGGSAGGVGTTTSGATPGVGNAPGAGGGGCNNRAGTGANTTIKGGNGAAGKIVITSTASLITFADLTVGKTYGDADFTKTATSSSAGAITYSSDSTQVATVDATSGLVHIVNSGIAHITASQAADGGNPAGSASYTLTVIPVITLGALSDGGVIAVENSNGSTPASNPISFSVIGGGLKSDISIAFKASSNFELSTDNSTFTAVSPVKLTPTSGAVNATVYVRLKAGLGTGAIASSNTPLTLTATSANTKVVSPVAYVWGDALTLKGSSSLYFYYVPEAGPSAVDSIEVSGSYLGPNATALVVTPGSNIEISLSDSINSVFTSAPLSFTPTSGKVVAAKTIYTRLISGLVAATYNDATTKVTATITGETIGTKELQFVGIVDQSVGISTKSTSTVKCTIANNTMKVTGVAVGSKIEVYNSVGKQVKSMIATDSNTISLPGKGIYIVKAGSLVQKVVLR